MKDYKSSIALHADDSAAELELHALLTRGVFDSPADRARHILAVLMSDGSAAGRAIRAASPDETLDHARAEFAARVADGTRCVLCGRHGKIYRRQVNSGQARKLIVAFRRFGADWFSMPELVRDLGLPGRDEAALNYFGLIESSLGRRPDGGKLGLWRVTFKGRRYVERALAIPRYALVYNGEVLGFDGQERMIDAALGQAFDWDVLMGNKADTP